jgi:hypothetical protein
LPDTEGDVAAAMAASWNQRHGTTATPVDMWPCCQLLAESGFVVGQQEDLSAISLGPFKIAAARNEAAVRDFVEALFPAAVASLPSSTPLASAVTGGLTAVCLIFVKLIDRGVIFTRSPEDRLRWAVLMEIAAHNREDPPATLNGLTENAVLAAQDGASAGDVRDAVRWLLDRGLIARSDKSGGLEARI